MGLALVLVAPAACVTAALKQRLRHCAARPLLRPLDTVPSGSLTIVVGAVGAGKSSLLAAMLGEMAVLQGSVAARGSTAYTQQDSWIQVRWTNLLRFAPSLLYAASERKGALPLPARPQALLMLLGHHAWLACMCSASMPRPLPP